MQVLYHGNRRRPLVALTFDDGPDPLYTPGVLNVLKAEGVPATLFFLGRQVELYPEVARRAAAEGHEIGNHSYSHPYMTRISTGAIRVELERTAEAIRRVTGRASRTFRPPYIAWDRRLLREAQHYGYAIVNRDVDTQDWRGLPAEQVLANALPTLIGTLRECGFGFVTASALL